MLEKTFDPQKIEDAQYARWEQAGAFTCDVNSKKTPFTIMMPLPNVTGSLHIGHALTMSLQDIITRYHRMNGRDALWQPGTDHAGIATQMVVERLIEQEGTTRREMGREKFLERVWQWKEESGGTIVNQLKKLGAGPDWSRERFTLDEGLSNAVRKVFVKMYEDGLIYRDKRLVNWDPKLRTAVSDLEVEFREVKGKLYHFRYPFEDGSGYVTVATTRPETVLGDGAVAVHPDDERYKDLIGKFVVVPVADRIVPIVADAYVKSDFGSGVVKITAAHDFNDFEIYKRHKDKGIPIINILTDDALLNDEVPEEYRGLSRTAAREKIVADFDDLEYLEKIEDHVHQVPFSQRSGDVIEPYLTDQWYCDAPTLAKPALKAVEEGKTVFVPKNWEKTYFEWMRNIQPWCISRQLWWGHQIPAWHGPDGKIFVAESEDDAYKQADAFYGESVTLQRDPDVLDTWFSSGLWPFSTLGWPEKTPELKKYYPGDVLITGFDIIFFWVARMMMMGIYCMGDVPFRTVYLHALVRDAKGQKMSKSRGNVMDPLDLIEKYGADAIRFTLTAMAAQGRDIKLSEDRVEGYRNFATKLWNAARYCEMNECHPDPEFNPETVEATPNKWIVSEVVRTKNEIDQAMTQYRFNDAAMAIYQFAWGTFCDWYLEFTKPLLQNESPHTAEIRTTTAWVLDQILTMLNPFMPFITEELFTAIAERSDDRPLMMQSWPEYSDITDEKAAAEMIWLTEIISAIRSVRADMNVPAGAKIELLVKDGGKETQRRLKDYEEIIQRMARISAIQTVDAVPGGAIQTVLHEATLILPIADIIDLDQERARLEKEIEKLELNIKKIEQQLENEKFIQNAPEEIVAEQRSRKQEAESVREKLSQALKQLAAA